MWKTFWGKAMLQAQISELLSDAIDAIREANKLESVLKALERVDSEIEKGLLGIVSDSSEKIQAGTNLINAHVTSVSGVVASVSARFLFKEIEALDQKLRQLLVRDFPSSYQIVSILKNLEDFAESYNTFVLKQKQSGALPVLAIGRQLRQQLDDLLGLAIYIRDILSSEGEIRPEEGVLTILLPSVEDLPTFADKLTALATIYSELCQLLNVSLSQHPLRISKVESGSLWAKVFGLKKVVDLTAQLLDSAARYCYRNYTREGKIGAVPSTVESMDAILGFTNKLKDAGVDVSTIHAEIAKGAHAVAKNLTALIADQPSMKIDGHTISVVVEVSRPYLENERLRLPNGSSSSSFPQIEENADGDPPG
jgi:hypothetical protein